MSAPIEQTPSRVILLRQVQGPLWCVVRWQRHGDKFAFAGRIATARPYERAISAALTAGYAERLPLAVCASGSRPRAFNPKRDMQEPSA